MKKVFLWACASLAALMLMSTSPVQARYVVLGHVDLLLPGNGCGRADRTRDYVPASEVRAVADVARPEVAAKMNKTIRGPGADSGLMIDSKTIIEEYKLDAAGYQLQPGKPADWIAWFDANLAAGKWFATPLRQPLYLKRVAKLRVLEAPKELLGKTHSAHLVAPKAGAAEHGGEVVIQFIEPPCT